MYKKEPLASNLAGTGPTTQRGLCRDTVVRLQTRHHQFRDHNVVCQIVFSVKAVEPSWIEGLYSEPFCPGEPVVREPVEGAF